MLASVLMMELSGPIFGIPDYGWMDYNHPKQRIEA